MMVNCDVSDAFQTWMETEGCHDAQGLGLMAACEADVQSDIIDLAVAAKVPCATIKEKIAVKKLWMAARKAMTTGDPSAAGGPESPMPKETADDIEEVWKKTHGFTLPEEWLLIPNLQGKLWRGLNKKPPVLEILLAEALRPLSCSDKATKATMNIVPGQVVEAGEVIVDSVHRPVELYSRIRAYYMTVAYVCIRNRAFFDLQSSIAVSEKVLHLVTQTFDRGQVAPCSFYVTAWASTIHHLSEAVRVNKSTLKEAVAATGQWEHRWLNWTPKSGGGVPDLPKQVAEDISKVRADCSAWQRKADTYRAEIERLKRQADNKNQGNKGNGKNNKNKSGGKKGNGYGGGGGDRGEKREGHGRDDRDGYRR